MSGRSMPKRNRTINLPAPYLKRLWLERERVAEAQAYPFCLPFLRHGLDLSFDRASPSSSARTAPAIDAARGHRRARRL